MADEPAPKKAESGGLLAKVVAAIFASVVAPIVVAVGVQWAKELHTQPEKPETHASTRKETAPIPPGIGVTSLLTSNLGEHFYQYAWNEEQKKAVRSDKIDPAIFRYEAKPDRIVVTGSKLPALLTTRAEYTDYVLHVKYRMGAKAWEGDNPPPQGKPRAATVVVHINGPDGASGGIWAQGIGVWLGDGLAGSFSLGADPGVIRGKARVVESPDRLRRVFTLDAPPIPQVSGEPEATWLILRRDFPADIPTSLRDERMVRGWHPEGDVTMKKVFPPYEPNEWNVLRIECVQGTVRVSINKKLVNELTDLNVRKGRICVTSKYADWEIGRFDIETQTPAKSAEPPTEKKQP